MAQLDTESPLFEKYYDTFKKNFNSVQRRENLEEIQHVSQGDDEDQYDFNYPERGLAVIINNEHFTNIADRKGSDVDATTLEDIYVKLGFQVKRYDDLTGDQMVQTLQKVAGNVDYDHRLADCFACAILSHGDMQEIDECDTTAQPHKAKVKHDILYGADGTVVPTRHLVSIFNDECCPELKGKPRLFFLQACRGHDKDAGMDMVVLREQAVPGDAGEHATQDRVDGEAYQEEQRDEAAARITLSPSPVYRDFLIMYAAPPGFYAWRNELHGSWMVQSFRAVMSATDVSDVSFTTLLTKVNREVSKREAKNNQKGMNKKKAIPCIMSMLRKDVYFSTKNPV
ncbi:caspase-3-like [Haliotis cracherodii]|uniref:caspase-3-like n=1 Tax=Haliotis cracherodii TaxID=6455 RepID=UPI0039E7BA73